MGTDSMLDPTPRKESRLLNDLDGLSVTFGNLQEKVQRLQKRLEPITLPSDSVCETDGNPEPVSSQALGEIRVLERRMGLLMAQVEDTINRLEC